MKEVQGIASKLKIRLVVLHGSTKPTLDPAQLISSLHPA
jgi:hypothetical protein